MTQPRSVTKNRRLSARRLPKRSTQLTCQKGSTGLGANLALALLDLSETGIRLVVKEPLAKGQEIEIGLLPQTQNRPIKILANVAWCLATAEGTYCIGAGFQRSLPYADLTYLT